MASIETLARASKVLFDQRLVDQRKEIEALTKENDMLRLELFWKDHDMTNLKNAMALANANHTKCLCSGCVLTKRDAHVDPDEGVHTSTCVFTPWFEELIAHCEMVTVTCNRQSKNPQQQAVSFLSRNDCIEADSHFVFFPSPGPGLIAFMFGERLWKTTTTNDPELFKLELLKEMLLNSE